MLPCEEIEAYVGHGVSSSSLLELCLVDVGAEND